jgi:tetratricopeptide (TPR) repeat protein
MGRTVATALIALVVLVASAAHAENRARAREAFVRGSQHYDLGEYKEALVDFKEAYHEFEDATFLFNIAQCYRQLEQKPEAIRLYRSYLVKSPNAPNRDEVRALIARLEAAVEQERLAKVSPPDGTLKPSEQGHTGGSESGAATGTTTGAMTLTATPPPRQEQPIYKRWWLWTAVGVVAATGLAVGLGVGLSQPNERVLPPATGAP